MPIDSHKGSSGMASSILSDTSPHVTTQQTKEQEAQSPYTPAEQVSLEPLSSSSVELNHPMEVYLPECK